MVSDLSPGGHHHHAVLPAGAEVHVLPDDERGAPGAQAAGLEVVGPEEAVRLAAQTPDVQGVGHAGTSLVSLALIYI